MRTRLRSLLFALIALGSFAVRAQTETFELRADAPMVGRSVNVTDSSGTWNAGNFALTHGAGGSVAECAAVVPGVSLPVGNPDETLVFEAGGFVAQVGASTLDAVRASGHVLWLSFASTGGGAPMREFLVGEDRAGHALGLAQPGGANGRAIVTQLIANGKGGKGSGGKGVVRIFLPRVEWLERELGCHAKSESNMLERRITSCAGETGGRRFMRMTTTGGCIWRRWRRWWARRDGRSTPTC